MIKIATLDQGKWGALIKALRSERRISQRRMSYDLGVNRTALRRLEMGRLYDIRLIEVVFRYLGYELDAILIENEDVAEIVLD